MKVHPNLKCLLGSTFYMKGTSGCNIKMKMCSNPKTCKKRKHRKSMKQERENRDIDSL